MPKHLTIWTQALILALGACPLPPGLLGMALTSAAGCQLGENAPIPCVVHGHDVGPLLYAMAASIRYAALTIPLAILALIVWRIALYFVNRHTESAGGRQQIQMDDSREARLKFPGPLTIGPPLRGRLFWLFVAACLTMICASIDTTTIGTADFIGVVTMAMVVKLLPGSHTLRLDASGFETTRWFYTRRYDWSDVSDFAVWGFNGWLVVTFNDNRLRPGIFGRMRPALMDGRNAVLPNSYAAAEDLARFMKTWRNSALRRRGLEQKQPPGPTEVCASQKTSERAEYQGSASLR